MAALPHIKNWKQSLNTIAHSPKNYAQALTELKQKLNDAFTSGTPVDKLLLCHSQAMDELLRHIWNSLRLGQRKLTLVATGGYGRRELHPASDIDLLVLVGNRISKDDEESVSDFITFLWDLGLDVGHAVRTISECESEALAELATITSLIEARFLDGNTDLYQHLQGLINPDNLWNSRDFFQAKMDELHQRKEKFGISAYKLEPNIKESPGGLRDIHVINWVTRRHYNSTHLEDLIGSQFLTSNEYAELTEKRDLLWAIRWALHGLSKRKEDRLLFDYQYDLAQQLGYTRETRNESIEAFMRDYYLAVTAIKRLTIILLQHFDEEIIATGTPVVRSLNPRFKITNGLLEITHDKVFEDSPSAILELFLLLQQQADLKGVRASTIRLLRANLGVIDDDFRNDAINRSLFMSLLRQTDGVTHEFRRMHFLGVLDAYLPNFQKITGRMQFDLFHIYTIDEHILMVLRNVRRLGVEKYNHELPECSAIFKELAKPELLYIAALFHDIAKGRNGDHSILGQEDARLFCQRHQLGEQDTELVAWLVKTHLTMSLTAQRKDISDPEVLNSFAKITGSVDRLRYLYLLTVSDIRGTDPKLWNSWKATLLSGLYHNTVDWFDKYADKKPDQNQWLENNKQSARQLLLDKGFSETHISTIWEELHPDYFLRFSADEIVWHSQISHDKSEDKSVFIRPVSGKGATEILIHTKVKPKFFMLLTRGMQQLNLNILDARIYSTRSGFAIDSFHVLENDGSPCNDDYRLNEIRENLEQILASSEDDIQFMTRPSRKLELFDTPTSISFNDLKTRKLTEIVITTGDRPGLLADIAALLFDFGIKLKMARITTAGEIAKDTLQIVDENDKPLNKTLQNQLQAKLISQLQI